MSQPQNECKFPNLKLSVEIMHYKDLECSGGMICNHGVIIVRVDSHEIVHPDNKVRTKEKKRKEKEGKGNVFCPQFSLTETEECLSNAGDTVCHILV